MTALIDLHVAFSANNAAYQAACLTAANSFPADINVYTVTGATSLLHARQEGFAQGSAPYVSWCDDDDTVTNLSAVTAYLNAHHPAALFTNSNIINASGVVQNQLFVPGYVYSKKQHVLGLTRPHQLVVIRRQLAQAALKGVLECATELGTTAVAAWPAELALGLEIALVANWTYLDAVCYNWRVHSSAQIHIPSTQYAGPILSYYQKKFQK
jgi:hypothetical protein